MATVGKGLNVLQLDVQYTVLLCDSVVKLRSLLTVSHCACVSILISFVFCN